MVICLERGADLHTAQLMPLPLTISCSSKIQIALPIWYRLTCVVLDKGPLSGCMSTLHIHDGEERMKKGKVFAPFSSKGPGQSAQLLLLGRVSGCRMAECPVVLGQSAHFSWLSRDKVPTCSGAECPVVAWQSAQLS